MEFSAPFQTKEQLRAYYHKLKIERNIYDQKIQNWLNFQSYKQQEIINNGIDVDAIHIKTYDLPFGLVKFINNTSSMAYKQRPGRRMSLTIWHDDTYIGLIQYASPVINARISAVLKEKYSDFNFKILNDKVVELSVCVPSGVITRYLGGKLLVFIAMSSENINMYNNRYQTNVDIMFTTSIFGKSSMYNRVRGLKYLGLTTGYNSALTKQDTEYIYKMYQERYPTRKITKSALAPHIIRMYDHLVADGVDMPFKIYKMQRGVYMADAFLPMQNNIEYFIERWFLPRKQRIGIINNKGSNDRPKNFQAMLI